MTAVLSPLEPCSLRQPGLRFKPDHAPANNTYKTPSLVHHAPVTPAESNEVNGLGERWNWRRPQFRGIDLTKPDPRIEPDSYEIVCTEPDTRVVFKDVDILDCTGKELYRGAVLVRDNRIVSVGPAVSDEEECRGARVIEGRGRTLMSGMVDAHTHLTWSDDRTLDALADMSVEEHTIFTVSSARSFLDCGYMMCVGAAAANLSSVWML